MTAATDVRVSTSVMFEPAGRSPVEISRAALEREARLTRAKAALDRLTTRQTNLKLPKDAVSLIRELRDAR